MLRPLFVRRLNSSRSIVHHLGENSKFEIGISYAFSYVWNPFPVDRPKRPAHLYRVT